MWKIGQWTIENFKCWKTGSSCSNYYFSILPKAKTLSAVLVRNFKIVSTRLNDFLWCPCNYLLPYKIKIEEISISNLTHKGNIKGLKRKYVHATIKGIMRFCRSGNRLSVGQMCCDLSTKARMWPKRLQSIHSCCQIISYPLRGLGKVVPKNGNSG